MPLPASWPREERAKERKEVLRLFARRHCLEKNRVSGPYSKVEAALLVKKKCVHVNLVTKRVPGLPNEQEFLFAPYSAFTVRSARWGAGTDTDPHVIDLQAAPDNEGAPEGLPLALWPWATQRGSERDQPPAAVRWVPLSDDLKRAIRMTIIKLDKESCVVQRPAEQTLPSRLGVAALRPQTETVPKQRRLYCPPLPAQRAPLQQPNPRDILDYHVAAEVKLLW